MTTLEERFEKILTHYPEISAQWLKKGHGPMFLNSSQTTENSMVEALHMLKVYKKLMEDQIGENMKLRELFSEGKTE